MKTIGIDLGTTSVSGVVYDEDTGEKVSISREHHASMETPDRWENLQNPYVLIQTAKEVLDDLLKQYPDVERIGLTGQMHGIVYLNSEGEIVSPLYTWQDQRGSYAQEGESLVETINREGKVRVASGYGLVTHIFNEDYEICPLEAVSLATISDAFGMILTERKTPLMHSSNAASLGFWNLEKGCFEEEYLEHFGVVKEILPQVTKEIELLGTYHGIPVTCAIGDNQASYLGAVGYQEDALLLNIGTGGQVSMRTDSCRVVEGIETRPYLYGDYLLVGASLCGGKAYAALERFFREYVKEATGIETDQYAVMEKLAKKAHGSTLQVCTELLGNRTNPEIRGSITGIDEGNLQAEELIYAFEEGMIQELFHYYERMGVSAKELYGAGNGLSRNSVLQSIAAKMFQMELLMCETSEEAACGAAMSALRIIES